MVKDISLRFLGTSSQTNISRNYSSLLVKLDHHTVMIDCGESTQRQLQNRHIGGDERLSNIRHILITHLHADHVLGLVPLLCTLMGPSNAVDPSEGKRPRVEIFGPSGIRALIRTTLTLCYTNLTGYYCVHELLWPNQSAYSNAPIIAEDEQVIAASIPESTEPLLGAMNGPQRTIPHLPPLDSELPGIDFRLDEQTASWPSITSISGVVVSAAPILHRCPAVGYVFEEPDAASTSVSTEMLDALQANAAALEAQQNIKNPKVLLGKLTRDRKSVTLPDGTILHPPELDIPGRKVVVLGDTYDATAGLDASADYEARGMASLAENADVLVHECTNAALPGSLTPGKREEDEKHDEVRAKALMRGHSTPQVAGQFAARCGAKQLLLNHFSIKYPAPHPLFAANYSQDDPTPRGDQERRFLALQEIERQATEVWHNGIPGDAIHREAALQRKAIAAFDGFLYRVPLQNEHDHSNGSINNTHDSSQQDFDYSIGSQSLDSYVSSPPRRGRGSGRRPFGQQHFRGRGGRQSNGSSRGQYSSSSPRGQKTVYE
ncbi:Metallo-hydrolase/oxidoreductase [Meira miltonrushii]|uniref:Metallo-hydrolase/oxidoreductase n=1 Tax=Meira miltonrushii TaxID=1280837 RepID=A0A316VQU5_9BASI|nr:Metallo-hydrolase/oxidoreductase [Meira miltonrushii]PWN37875.1 Metallo-hydrolase/oxidoreductase [Meira miltonrushii]